MHDHAPLWPTALGVAVLVLLTLGVLRAAGVPRPTAPGRAILRGAVQLAAVSVVLGHVIEGGPWLPVALLVMFAVATVTAARRVGGGAHHLRVVAASMAAGVGVAVTVVFATGALEPSARYALAIGGIVIGNAMTIATLAGRRFHEAVDDHWGEVEAWLALGATPRQATRDLARAAVASALVPSTDQTRTTGLVTLPGAFVGAVFGGASPVEAGRFQVVVLAAIMAAGAVTAVLVVRSLAPVGTRPVPTP